MNTVKFNKRNTLVVAHRGLSGIETENTNAAFVAAGNRSYYGIETDIHRTADGQFVVVHDDNLERVSGQNVPVETTDLSTLQDIILFDRDGNKDRADLRVSTLENYIKICKKYGKHCVLELKSGFTDEETVKIIDIIREYGYLENVTFISFVYENLLKIRKVIPTQPAQYLFSNVTDEIVERVAADKIDVDVFFESLTKENIARFHELNIKVNCWTVDNKEAAEQLAEWGVDFITSNILE